MVVTFFGSLSLFRVSLKQRFRLPRQPSGPYHGYPKMGDSSPQPDLVNAAICAGNRWLGSNARFSRKTLQHSPRHPFCSTRLTPPTCSSSWYHASRLSHLEHNQELAPSRCTQCPYDSYAATHCMEKLHQRCIPGHNRTRKVTRVYLC